MWGVFQVNTGLSCIHPWEFWEWKASELSSKLATEQPTFEQFSNSKWFQINIGVLSYTTNFGVLNWALGLVSSCLTQVNGHPQCMHSMPEVTWSIYAQSSSNSSPVRSVKVEFKPHVVFVPKMWLYAPGGSKREDREINSLKNNFLMNKFTAYKAFLSHIVSPFFFLLAQKVNNQYSIISLIFFLICSKVHVTSSSHILHPPTSSPSYM